MTIEEIRKNAPKGATHYSIRDNNISYFKKEMVWFRESWFFCTLSKDIELKPL